METTIQISKSLAQKLKLRKLYDKESYEEVISNLLEDVTEISEQTKRDIAAGMADFKAGRVYTHAQMKKRLGL